MLRIHRGHIVVLVTITVRLVMENYIGIIKLTLIPATEAFLSNQGMSAYLLGVTLHVMSRLGKRDR